MLLLLFSLIIATLVFILIVLIRSLNVDTILTKGEYGERKVAKLLVELDDSYTCYHDIYVKKKDGNMTQLDHVIISKYGIFVIETKNFTGWIFGNQKQRNWTQVIYKKKSRFYNPIMQNKAHIKALINYLQVEKNINSVIVFSDKVTFKFEEEFQNVNVIKMSQLQQVIRSFSEIHFTTRQIEIINERMNQLKMLKGKNQKNVKNAHLSYVKEVQFSVEERQLKNQKLEAQKQAILINENKQINGVENVKVEVLKIEEEIKIEKVDNQILVEDKE